MKGIGVAGGSGPPRPPQPPSRPRRGHILCGPCEAQTPTPPSPGIARASAVLPAARDPVRLGSLRGRPCRPGPPWVAWAFHPGAVDAAFVGEWAGPRGCGRPDRAFRTARERVRSPQRVRPLLPVRLPLWIPALASDLREGLLNTIRLPESDEPGETLLRCRRCSLLWWVSASRDSTREYVVKTLVEAYFFGVSSFPAPGDLANTHVCAGRWSGACVPGRFAGVRGSCLVAWAWPLVETFLSTRETWNFIFTWHLEIELELSDWNVCFWCSLFPLFALLQITMAFCGVG